MLKNIFLSLIALTSINLSAAQVSEEWTKGEPFPPAKAIVKTIKEIHEDYEKIKQIARAERAKKHLFGKNPQWLIAMNDAQEVKAPLAESKRQEKLPNFTAATFADSGVVPPDAMGVIGPQQFILAANGRIRSFSKETGKADGILDVSSTEFFNSVGKGFTTDSRIRYDRFSDRWYILIIAAEMSPIRFMLAVSSEGIVSLDTKWSFYYIEPRPTGSPDYPTLGIDKHALYIGLNYLKEGYITSDGIVINKAALLSGDLKAFAFRNLVDPDPTKFEGPISPQGVDNYDSDADEGYFIGIDGRPGKLMLRRIKDPESDEPMISKNVEIPVSHSDFPLNVPQKGSLQSDLFFLQGFDKRLGNSHVRDKKLYTAHNVGVDNKGDVESTAPTRNGCLWYEIDVTKAESPKMLQSGILYQTSRVNDKNERFYWMPGVMTNGLHTLVIACCTSGNDEFANAAYAWRYSDDPLGMLHPPQIYTDSKVVYNLGHPPFKNLRWGEYTTASVDPLDNMTLWCISEFALTPTSWGLQCIRIPAPLPAEIVEIIPKELPLQQKRLPVSIMGKRVEGSAFYNTDSSYPNQLKVEIDGVKIKTIVWKNPTQIDLIVSTEKTTPGVKAYKITNPDGQSVIGQIEVRSQVTP